MQGRPTGNNGRPAKYTYGVRIGPALFDLVDDPGELHDVAELHPEVVARMRALAASARNELGDSLNEIDGVEIREPMRVE
jgi:hypothetical protein